MVSAEFRGPDPHPRRPAIKVPQGAWDCHAHMFGPVGQYPTIPHVGYEIAGADLEAYRRLVRTLGISRAVLVQPHVYGSDNRCLLDALTASEGQWRGVAVITADVTDSDLERMHHAGVRGVRVNLRNEGGLGLEDAPRMADRIRSLGWHLEFAAVGAHLGAIVECARNIRADIVIPHMGRVPPSLGVRHPGFQGILGLVREGRCWVKLSAAHRFSAQPPPHADVMPFVEALMSASEERLLWATDWPHTRVRVSEYMPNDGDLLDVFAEWIRDDRVMEKILVRNPLKLYDSV